VSDFFTVLRVAAPCSLVVVVVSSVIDTTLFWIIAGSTTGPNYYVRVLSTIDRELLKPNSSVALHKHSNALVDVLPPEADSSIAMLTAEEKPDVSYADIGVVILLLWFMYD
jgi:ATP-dependent 26S proteasome regulatory subunit